MTLWIDMEKRLILAIALSLLVLLAWSALMPKPQPVVVQGVKTDIPMPPSPTTSKEQAIPQAAQKLTEKLLTYKQENLEVVFDETQAFLKNAIFKHYSNHPLSLGYGFLLSDPSLVYAKSGSSGNSITFCSTNTAKKVTKKFIFHKSNYTIDLEIKIQNISTAPVTINMPLLLGVLDFSGNNPQARYQDVTIGTEEKSSHINGRKTTQFSDIKFLGMRDQYFTAIIEPQSIRSSAFISKLNNQESEVGLNVQTEILQPGSQIGHLYRIYIGPQDLKVLGNINPAWAGVIHYGTFDFISQILLQALNFLHNIVRNWGLAIICLSLLVYLLLYPLSLKQMRSMKEMQVLQPKVEALRKAYKDNPQRMNKEIMELYKEHKVNPLGGCLPLLLQMPIFFALYNALMRSIVLKGAKFLWIKDLSEPDRLWVFPDSWPNLPIIGHEFNILPIIMAIGMFVQQKISSTSASGASADQQKIMLIVMPVMFGLIFYRMPSGLVLYWFVNSILMLVFQLRLNKVK